MSSINGPITRSEVISRAQNWVDRRIPYSQSAYSSDPDCGKTYRQDCSGYVSMAWHLDTSLNTTTLPGRSTPITFANVKAGDAVAYSGHVAIAAAPPSGGYITIYQERSPGYTAQKVSNPLSLYSNAYRYNNITDDVIDPTDGGYQYGYPTPHVVEDIQLHLQAMGIYNGPIDQLNDDDMRAAIRRWMNNAPTDTAAVRHLQLHLNNNAGQSLVLDGSFGMYTNQAVCDAKHAGRL